MLVIYPYLGFAQIRFGMSFEEVRELARATLMRTWTWLDGVTPRYDVFPDFVFSYDDQGRLECCHIFHMHSVECKGCVINCDSFKTACETFSDVTDDVINVKVDPSGELVAVFSLELGMSVSYMEPPSTEWPKGAGELTISCYQRLSYQYCEDYVRSLLEHTSVAGFDKSEADSYLDHGEVALALESYCYMALMCSVEIDLHTYCEIRSLCKHLGLDEECWGWLNVAADKLYPDDWNEERIALAALDVATDPNNSKFDIRMDGMCRELISGFSAGLELAVVVADGAILWSRPRDIAFCSKKRSELGARFNNS